MYLLHTTRIVSIVELAAAVLASYDVGFIVNTLIYQVCIISHLNINIYKQRLTYTAGPALCTLCTAQLLLFIIK